MQKSVPDIQSFPQAVPKAPTGPFSRSVDSRQPTFDRLGPLGTDQNPEALNLLANHFPKFLGHLHHIVMPVGWQNVLSPVT